MDMLDAHKLLTAVAQPSKYLDLGCISHKDLAVDVGLCIGTAPEPVEIWALFRK